MGWRRNTAAGAACIVLLAAGAIAWLQEAGISPRALGHYLERRAGADALLGPAETLAAGALARLDPAFAVAIDPARLAIGANGAGDAARALPLRVVRVAGAAELRRAIDAALPGDLIELAPASYRISATLEARMAGTAVAPIVVSGAAANGAVIEFDTVEGFAVTAPHWRFERLALRGVCASHSSCEHAFHVSGNAHHFTAIGNTVSDFNAHFKINGNGGRFPDDGRIEANTLTNGAVRQTANPVSVIDLVGASGWAIRRNLVADFIKGGGDRISYGAFAKGGGARNVFAQNIVWCERLLHGQPGQRVGLSLGGGGTDAAYCRDRKCVTEQEDSTIASNLVVACSDDGIYLNSAARSRVLHNTLSGTEGITLRHPGTSADLEGNVFDGPIRTFGGAIARATDNLSAPLAYRYLGLQRDDGPLAGAALRRPVPAPVARDLCGALRPAAPRYGAFEDFSACASR